MCSLLPIAAVKLWSNFYGEGGADSWNENKMLCVWIKPGAPENYRVVTATATVDVVAAAAVADFVVAVIFGHMAKMLVRNSSEMSCEQSQPKCKVNKKHRNY